VTTFDRYASRLAHLDELRDRIDNGDDEAYDELSEYPLSIERETVYRIGLGAGGPHDEVAVTVNEHGEITGGEYRYWWRGMDDHGTRDLGRDEAQRWADAFGIEAM
jgi:hypothetical protein